MTEFVEYLARGVVQLRAEHAASHAIKSEQHSRYGGPAPKQAVVGGYVRSYRFQYDPAQPIAQGTMTIESNEAPIWNEKDVTILFLSDEEACNGKTGERIVSETRKLAYCPDSIAEAYFSAYCEAIGRWVVVYERFDGFFSSKDAAAALPPFFPDEDKSKLTPFWRAKIRSFIAAISLSKSRRVVHGGLDRTTSYVISSGTVKIINVGRYQGSRDYVDDLYHLRSFIWTSPFFSVTDSADWDGFQYLLGSRKMQQTDWEIVLLNHPILLEPYDILVSIEELETFMWGKDWLQARFANVLYVKMPKYRWRHLAYFLDLTNPVHKGVLAAMTPHSIIYLAIIQFVRNIHHHANDHIYEIWDSSRMVQERNTLFPGFMSMAYSVRHVTNADWSDLLDHHPETKKFARRSFYR